MAYEYIDGDSSIGHINYLADGSYVPESAIYRLIGNIWTKVTQEGPASAPVSYNEAMRMYLDLAQISIDQGTIYAINGAYPNGSGQFNIASPYIEAFRFLVANGSATMAQAETALSKCYTLITPSMFIDGYPTTVPSEVFSVSDNPAEYVFVKATEYLKRPMGSIDDSALMATLPNGNKMPWSIPAGTSAAEAMVESWSTDTPQLYGGAGAKMFAATDGPAMIIENVVVAGGGSVDYDVADDVTASVTFATPFSVNNGQYVDLAQKGYIAFFNRPADSGGLNGWTDYLAANNGDMTKMMNDFGSFPEYARLYDNKTTHELLDAVYTNLFGRLPVEQGYKYWTEQLDTGKMTVAQAAYYIMEGATGDDALKITNKIAAAKAFTSTMNDSAKVEAFVGRAAAEKGGDFLETITANSNSVLVAKAKIGDFLRDVGISGSVSGDTIHLDHAGRATNVISFGPTQSLKEVTILGFSNDKIDLSDFAFTGTKAGVVTKDAIQTSANASYFGTKGVAFADVGDSAYIYVDANKDGGFTPGIDFEITLTGISSEVISLVL